MKGTDRGILTLLSAVYLIAFALYRDYLHSASTLLSLALTPATIYLSIWVCMLWYEEAKTAWYSEERTPDGWFVMGVFISFFGSALDNTYWGVAWTAHYLSLPVTKVLFDNGVLSNLPFRQVTTTLAAYFHARASIEFSPDKSVGLSQLKRKIAYLIIVGSVFAGGLSWLK